MSEADAHCLDLVRTHDKDRFLSSLFVPDEKRADVLALYAFNVEIQKIREVVSEPQIGLIRHQWWRDTLDAIYTVGEDTGHPVAEALERAVVAGNIPRHALDGLLAAREFDLFSDKVENIGQLEGYLGETSSALIQMSAMLLDREAAPKASEAAGLAGVAHGLSLLLMNPERRTQFLPPGMDVAAAIAHARKRLSEARALIPTLPRSVLPAFLPASLTGAYLRSVERHPDRPQPVSQFRRQLSLWWSARQEKF